jgi:hypothetical protein
LLPLVKSGITTSLSPTFALPVKLPLKKVSPAATLSFES